MWIGRSRAVQRGSVHLEKPLRDASLRELPSRVAACRASFMLRSNRSTFPASSGNVVMVVSTALAHLRGLEWWAIVRLAHRWYTLVDEYFLYGCNCGVCIGRISEPFHLL